ncbi:DUF4954 family protein [Bacteroides ovatus]|nr:DUF4954 family protein [Bacteroides ovatus]
MNGPGSITKIQEFYGLNPETVTAQDVVTIVKAWQKAVVGLIKWFMKTQRKSSRFL